MTTWAEATKAMLDIEISGGSEYYVAGAIVVTLFFLIVMPFLWIRAFVDRKLTADLQARVGPNRAGRAGILQPLADTLKLFQKEMNASKGLRENLWMGVLTLGLYSTIAIMPLGGIFLLVDTHLSAIFPLVVVTLLALSMVTLGFDQGTVEGALGGIRSAAQVISGLFPALVSLLVVGLLSGSFSWTELVRAQGVSPFSWTAFQGPFQFVSFLVFYVSGMVILNVAPLGSGLSLPDIGGGVAAGLFGRGYALFLLGRAYAQMLWLAMTTVVFLGGWRIPEALSSALGGLNSLGGSALVLIKMFLLSAASGWLSKVNPFVRSDHVTDLCWKVLGPLSLLTLAGVLIFEAML